MTVFTLNKKIALMVRREKGLSIVQADIIFTEKAVTDLNECKEMLISVSQLAYKDRDQIRYLDGACEPQVIKISTSLVIAEQ